MAGSLTIAINLSVVSLTSSVGPPAIDEPAIIRVIKMKRGIIKKYLQTICASLGTGCWVLGIGYWVLVEDSDFSGVDC